MIFPTYTPAPPTQLDHVADYLLLGAGLVILIFTFLYGVLSRWTLTPGGISVMLFVTSLDALLALILVGKFQGGEYPGRDVVRFLVYGYVLATSTFLVINLLFTWFKGNDMTQFIAARKHDTAKRRRDLERTDRTSPGGQSTSATR